MLQWKKSSQKDRAALLSHMRSIVSRPGQPSLTGFVIEGSDDGAAGFVSTDIDHIIDALAPLISWPSDLPEAKKLKFLFRASCRAAKNEKFEEFDLLSELKIEIDQFRATPVRRWEMSANISLSESVRISQIELDGTVARFKGKFNNAERLAREDCGRYIQNLGNFKEPKGWKVVRLYVDDREGRDAADRMLTVLDSIRAILGIVHNPWRVIGFGSVPVFNTIALGPIQLVKEDSGKVWNSPFWFNQEFSSDSKVVSREGFEGKKLIVRKLLKDLKSCPYQEKVLNALSRYPKALDRRDRSVALAELWSILEGLTNSGGNHELCVERTAFMYENYEYNKALLRYLRNCRNLVVHQGLIPGKTETVGMNENNIWKLKEYVEGMFLYHIRFGGKNFYRLEDAASFLSSSPKSEEINAEIRRLQLALRYKSK